MILGCFERQLENGGPSIETPSTPTKSSATAQTGKVRWHSGQDPITESVECENEMKPSPIDSVSGNCKARAEKLAAMSRPAKDGCFLLVSL